MEIWWVSFVGGLVGALFMDLAEARMAKVGIGSGVTGVFIGRWVHGWSRGVWIHRDIAAAPSIPHEIAIAQLFHFVVGGGVVALGYPLLSTLAGVDPLVHPVAGATLFGLLTCLLPWLILMPAFGWGLFGARGPSGSRPWIAPVLSHIPYGLGIGLTLEIYLAVMG